jgi:hypothetical protein
MIRTTLLWLVGAALVIGTFWNLHIVDVGVAGLEPRDEEDVTVIENRYFPIEIKLVTDYPNAKRIGYVTALTLKGQPPDDLDNLRFAQLRYVMIPRILFRGTDEPFVIGNFKSGEPVPATPDNLVQVYDAGTGMILYKQKKTP